MSKLDQNAPVSFVLTPDERLKRQVNEFATVEIDANVPPKRYYRSGLEMVRMANVYLDEGQLENAYILYMKFATLFLEKIRTHPAYSSVSAADKAQNQQKLREVLPRAEELKVQLLSKYSLEYERYLSDQKRREEERIRQEKERHASVPPRGQADPLGTYTPSLVLQPVPPLPDNLHYSLEPSAPPHLPHDRPDDLRLTPSVPGVDRTTKPHSLLSPSTNNSQLVPGLRTVIIPQVLHARFIKLAQVSTERNIETCGILAGRLQRDQLVVSHLLVPKQHGGADYCNMEGEEEICAYSDQRELLTLGWIHTHPTQSAFLSSVDLHTHFSYQLMMPEAIAIVCAPKYQEVKVFCLTPHHGLNFIKNCRQPGFHPHPNDPPLFMVAEHYRMDGAAPLEVVDLRR